MQYIFCAKYVDSVSVIARFSPKHENSSLVSHRHRSLRCRAGAQIREYLRCV